MINDDAINTHVDHILRDLDTIMSTLSDADRRVLAHRLTQRIGLRRLRHERADMPATQQERRRVQGGHGEAWDDTNTTGA